MSILATRCGLVGLVVYGLPAVLPAQDLELPAGARLVVEEPAEPGTLRLATGPWDETLPVRQVEGPVTRQVWQIGATGLTSAQLMAQVRAAAEAEGYAPLFSCETEGCGGFDFRFALRTAPAPAMHVDLADFRYLAALGSDGNALEALVSISARTGFVQLSFAGGQAPQPTAQPLPAAAAEGGDLIETLERAGHTILGGLDFPSGSARLTTDRIPALVALARWLQETPSARVTLVGHTDAQGARDANITLSRRRAEAVRQALIDTHGARGAQIDADGMGALAPVASNLTEAGRAANRRVEVVLTAR